MSMFTEKEVFAWMKVYTNPDNKGKDLHQMFVELLECDRHTAKQECYKILFTSMTLDFVKSSFNISPKS